MQIVKRCYLLLLFALALLLVCGQLPELFTLIDDVSNDFVEESVAPAPQSVEAASVDTESQNLTVFGEESNRTVVISPAARPLPAFQTDLLRLLTIQRK